jgi:hypothetical protein
VLGVLADAVCAGLETSRVQVGHGEEHAEPADGGADVPNTERFDLRPEQGRTESRRTRTTQPIVDGESWPSPNADRRRLAQLEERNLEPSVGQSASLGNDALGRSACDWWQARADVRRVSDECPDRVDRLRMLGNGVLPLAVAVAFDALLADA